MTRSSAFKLRCLFSRFWPGASQTHVVVGPWAFSLPEGWRRSDLSDVDCLYLESADQTKGCYVRSLEFSVADFPSELSMARHIQAIHRDSFVPQPGTHWQVLGDEVSQRNGHLFSTSELFDAPAGYRILGCVLTRGQSAVQINLHDYLCEDLVASRRYFRATERSIRVQAPDADPLAVKPLSFMSIPGASPRQTFRRWNALACMLFLAGLGTVVFSGYPLAGGLVAVTALAAYLVAMYRVRCAHCGSHLLWDRARGWGGHAPFPAHCRRCGAPTLEEPSER